MPRRSLVASAVVLGAALVASPGQAQQTLRAPGPPDVLPPADEGASDAPDKSAPAPKAPMAGYAYGDKSTRTAAPRARHARFRKTGPVVNTPGFEQTAEGGSRLFVQLSQSVPVEERKAQGSITYVLKGASPRVWNNTNPLVTVHFNTPVTRARLVPQGQDLLFVIELRAAVTPTFKLTETPDKGATLTIDFPKGDYLPAAGGPAADARAVRAKGSPTPGSGSAEAKASAGAPAAGSKP